MDPSESEAGGETQSPQERAHDWNTALGVLHTHLETQGLVSTLALRKELERKGVVRAHEAINRLRFYTPESELPEGERRPDFVFFHSGRSFYSKERYEALQDETNAKAEVTAKEETAPEPEPERERRSNKQEEARLVTYVQQALDNLYWSDAGPEGLERVAFDVHNMRAGSEYENVDILAVHWRSAKRVDFVAVEVKLSFTAGLVHQAHNYTRFAHRVWIAIPVNASPEEAAVSLREENPSLFDYVIELGIGILACKRRQGRSYEVVPIHWPRRYACDSLEMDGFVERYRDVFEETRVVAPQRRHHYAELG